MTNAITATTNNYHLPTGLSEIQDWAQAFFVSGMFTDIKTAAQAVVKIQAGKELGLPPLYSMQNVNIINGKLSLSSNALALMVKKSGKYDYDVAKSDDTQCIINFCRIEGGKRVEIGQGGFSIKEATEAGLLRNPTWKSYPQNMLFARAVSRGARMHCPDAIGGAYTHEELESIPDNNTKVTYISTASTSSDEAFDALESAGDAYRTTKAAKESAAKVVEAEYEDQSTPDVEESQDQPVMCGHVPMELLEKVKEAGVWKTIGKDTKATYGVSGEKVTEIVANLSPTQATWFIQKCQERLEAGGVA